MQLRVMPPDGIADDQQSRLECKQPVPLSLLTLRPTQALSQVHVCSALRVVANTFDYSAPDLES